MTYTQATGTTACVAAGCVINAAGTYVCNPAWVPPTGCVRNPDNTYTGASCATAPADPHLSAATATFKLQTGALDGDGHKDFFYRGLCNGAECW